MRWINAFSVEAVAVGVLWQAIFSIGFRGSRPSLVEALTLGITLWLIYTADHLLDATRLDMERAHTFRHRVHRRHRLPIMAVWYVATLVDATLIIGLLPDSLIHWGLALAAVVMLYGANVHFRRDHQHRIGKEIQVGTIFAIGVGLLAWDHAATLPLGVATMMAAVLFSMNCILVAAWESETDHQQRFGSLATTAPWIVDQAALVLFILFVASMGVAMIEMLPRLVNASIALSSCLLMIASRLLRPRLLAGELSSSVPIGGQVADAILLIPVLCYGIV